MILFKIYNKFRLAGLADSENRGAGIQNIELTRVGACNMLVPRLFSMIAILIVLTSGFNPGAADKLDQGCQQFVTV